MESLQSQRSSHSEIDDRGMSLPGQPTELLEGKEPRAWINKEKWDIYIKGDTDNSRAPSDVSIFRVPIILKEQKKEAYYVPKIVSLGPYHYTSEKLDPMGRHKGRALRRMMTRSNTRRGNHLNLLEFSYRAKEEITKLDKKIRYSYEEDIGCDGESLAMMLTLDGCFILEILRTVDGDELEEASKCYDPIFGTEKIEYTGWHILYDILKLENQIPLIVLQDLQKLDLELNSYSFLAFLEGVLLSIFNPFNYDRTKWFNRQPHEPVHLLDLLYGLIVSPPCHPNDEDQIELDIRCSCCNRECRSSCSIRHQERDKLDKTGRDDTCHRTEDSRNPWNKFKCGSSWCTMQLKYTQKAQCVSPWNDLTSPRATELRNAGINFRTCSGGIKQIKFESKSATICLPPIIIADSTEVLFRNLIAFEMCKPSETHYVASYVCLMNDLIDSNEDVALLRRMGIVTNFVGSDAEVAELFNGLCKEITLSNNVFHRLALQLNAHYNNKIKIQIAKLVDEHFSSPWKFLGLAGAIILLLLGILQTIYTIKPVNKK